MGISYKEVKERLEYITGKTPVFSAVIGTISISAGVDLFKEGGYILASSGLLLGAIFLTGAVRGEYKLREERWQLKGREYSLQEELKQLREKRNLESITKE